MIKRILVFLACFQFLAVHAETIRTDVLVIGGTASGTAAAIQCARSKVKTVLIEPGPWLGGSMTAGGKCVLEANRNLPSGFWGEFRKKVTQYYKNRLGYDTTYNAILRFEPSVGASILKKTADTVKNLTVKLNTSWTSVKKETSGWDVTVTINGESTTIKTHVLVDATETGEVAAKAGASFNSADAKQEHSEQIAAEQSPLQLQDVSWIAILKDFGRNTTQTIAKPADYDASAYSCIKAADVKKMLNDGRLPNDKYMINWCANNYPLTPDDLKPEHRAAYYQRVRLHTLGLVYYLQTALGYKNLGLDDEFSTPDHLPYQPFIRESDRVKGVVRMVNDDVYKPYDRASKLYRTSIAVVEALPEQAYSSNNIQPVKYAPVPAFTIPLGSVVVKGVDNLLVVGSTISVAHLVNATTTDPAVQMTIGQGVGTVAAFLGFFKTTPEHLNTRIVQGELLDFKGYLVPVADITQKDPAFRAVQQVCATGLLKPIQVAKDNRVELHFAADSIVKTAEIKPVLNEIYTRAFLWFNREKPAEQFTIGNLLSFISEITLSDPKPFQLEMQKDWKTKYKFTTEYDANRPITRREFVVLANKFLNPFARKIDLTGKLIN